MPRTTPVLFLPSLSKERLNTYLFLGGILIAVGTALIYTGVWLVPALLITAIGVNVLAKFIAYAFPKLYYNKLAFSLGNAGVYAGCVAGFYLGSLFPGVGNILGALIGMGVGFVLGPVLSLGLANLFDRLGWAEPVGISYANQGGTVGWWLGSVVGAVVGFFTPVGPIIGGMIGIVAGSSLIALFMGIAAHFIKESKPFEPDLYCDDLPSSAMIKLMVDELDKTVPALRKQPEQYLASERIVDVTWYRRQVVQPSEYGKYPYSHFLQKNPMGTNQQLTEEIVNMQLPQEKATSNIQVLSITPKA